MASDVFNKYSCTCCQEEIKSLRVKCTECSSFELCLQCFSAGAEIGPHKKDHTYQFIDSVACDIFRDRSGWSGREELYLLNAIEHYGYGNWQDISQHIGTRNPEEAKEEYVGRYLSGNIGRHTWGAETRGRCRLTDLTTPSPSAPSHSTPDAIVRSEDAKQLEYIPLRDEFEVEYDNEAEYLVSSLTVNPDDDELDSALKCSLMEMYTQRLRDRSHRRQVIRDNNLIAKFFNRDVSKKKMSKEERELNVQLRRVCGAAGVGEGGEARGLVERVVRQRRLSRRLTELLRYRRNGITRTEEIPHFDQERQLRRNSKPGGAASGLQSPSPIKKENSSALAKDGVLEPQLFAHLLNKSEMQVCSTLDMKPSQYISMKTLMVTDSRCRTAATADDNLVGHQRAVLDHLAASGWLADVVKAERA